MPFPDDPIDPYAPEPPRDGWWGWGPPPEWEQQALGAAPAPVPAPADSLQPGIGVPTSALEAAAEQSATEQREGGGGAGAGGSGTGIGTAGGPASVNANPIGDSSLALTPPGGGADPHPVVASLAAQHEQDNPWIASLRDAPPALPEVPTFDQAAALQLGLGIPTAPIADWMGHTGGYAEPLDREPGFDAQVDGLDWVARNDPEGYARLQGKQVLAEAEHRAELEEAASRAERERAAAREQRSAETWKRAEARAEENDAEAKKLANERIDPDHWWSSRSTGQKIAGFIAAIVGGLVQGRTGSPRNSGLDMINQEIDRDIDAQKANLANRRDNLGIQRGLVADLYARTGDLERSAEIAGIAARQRAMADLEHQLGSYDRNGKTAHIIVNALQAGRSEAQVARDRRTAADHKIQMDKADLLLKEAKQAEDERNNRAQNRTANYGIASTNKREANRLVFDEKKLAADGLKDERAATHAADAEVLKLGMGGSVRLKRDANNQPIIGVDGRPEVVRGNLVNADGQPWKARNEAVADDLAKKQAVAADLIDYYDEIIAIRDRSGGESAIMNSDDRQRLDVLEDLILKRSKEGTSGMSSNDDMAVLRGAAGAKDVASFRAKGAGLEKGREKVVATLNNEMRHRGNYTGEPMTFENKYQAAPKNTKEDVRIKELQKKPAVSIDEADRQATAIVKKRITPDDMRRDPTLIKQFSAEVAELKADYKEISPQQRVDIAQLGDVAGGAGPAADAAMADLANLVKDAQTSKLREVALAAQRSALMSRGGSK